MQLKFNKNWNSLLKKHGVKDKVFAVGVSGGADSLALVLLLHKWAVNAGKKIVALTVDHGLRKESGKEAEYVAKCMKKFGIEHHILEWVGKKPESGMEEAARTARYDLIEKWCAKNKVKILATGHHKFDQAETFLMRLQRGSGVSGLAGMLEITPRGNIKIMRPLLPFMPIELKNFLADEKVKWIEDPHNQMDDFLRVRIRKLIPFLDKEIGLSVDKMVDTAARMARARDYLESVVAKFNVEFISCFGKVVCFSRKEFLALHEEVGLRILAFWLQKTGSKDYSPRMENLERLWQSLAQAKFVSSTLSDCEVMIFQGKIWIVPELKKRAVLPKKEWENFLKKNPKYKNIKMPYKARLFLVLNDTILV